MTSTEAAARRSIVGGYHALSHEADPGPLLKALVDRGCHIVFPRIVAKDMPLEFHRVPDGEVLRPGAFGVQEPAAHWPAVMPHLLLVPLLAFDAHGYRLGYGGGFYDRTLYAFRTGRFPYPRHRHRLCRAGRPPRFRMSRMIWRWTASSPKQGLRLFSGARQ